VIRAIYKQPGRGEKLDGGKIPGQVYLQECINKDEDEDDLPFAAIQLGIFLLGEDHFNHLLEIRDCPHRIAKVQDRYVVMVGNGAGGALRRHWSHDDLIFSDGRIRNAANAGGIFPRTASGLQCQNVINWEQALFEGVDETSDPPRLRLSLVGDFIEGNQHLLNDNTRTDLMTITSKRTSWTAFITMCNKVRAGLHAMTPAELGSLGDMIVRLNIHSETCDKASYLASLGASLNEVNQERTRQQREQQSELRARIRDRSNARQRGQGLVLPPRR